MAGLVVSAGEDGGRCWCAGNAVSGLRGLTRVVALELRILGPVQAVRDGRDVPLGGPKQRAVLALLVLDVGRTVPAGQLAEALWLGSPPSGAAKTLRSYVSRLRTVLAPETAVTARGGGYALIADPDQVDAARFERLVGAGQGALGLGEAASAAGRFAEALALWRGRALADVTDVEPLALEAARLEELRLVAVEGRAEASIALGLHGEVIGELERLVAEYPVRERLWRLLVLALYRAERQADALAAYRRARVMLAEELGLEPGEELRELAQAVLRQEVPAAPRRQRHGLPVPLTSFVGREEEIAALGKLLGRARLVTLTGAGRGGQDAAGGRARRRAGERFADGVWLADLAGVTDAELVPSRVMEALGVRQTGDLPVIEALRYRLRSAELLLVLDNCEHLLDSCARLAADLLGSSPGLRVLATSREALGVPGEAVFVVPPLGVPAESADEADIALVARGAAVHGPGVGGPGRQRRGRGGGYGRGDLPGTGRAAAGDRAGRGPYQRLVGGGDRTAPGRQVPVPGPPAPGGRCAPSDAEGRHRLELSAAAGAGAGLLARIVGVRRGVPADRGGAGVLRGR